MGPSPDELAGALGLSQGATVTLAPMTAVSSRCQLATVREPSAAAREIVVRTFTEPEATARHAWALRALNQAAFPHATKLVAVVGNSACEELAPGLTAISVAIGFEEASSFASAAAALHASRFVAGPDGGTPEPGEPAELPLFRLGFDAGEREAARNPIRELQRKLGEHWSGPVHGQATAANVVLCDDRPVFLDFSLAGWGVQLFDVAAFVLSSGLAANERREAAKAYARARRLEEQPTADFVDAAGLLWGLGYLINLPRRQVELLGDDESMGWLTLLAERVSRGIREPAGGDPAAAALRAALWPD